MLTQETVSVLLIALAVNAAIVVGLLVTPVIRRHARNGAAPVADGDRTPTARPSAPASPDSAAPVVGPAAGEPWFMTPSAATVAHGVRPWATDGDGRVAPPPVPLPPMATPAEWDAWLDDETARVARYERPATVVLIELAGLDRLAERVGDAAAERLVPPIAATVRRHARASDRLARLGPTRFGVLLVETDEVSAINYVERIRSQCDIWLASGAVALRLSAGWAQLRPDAGRLGAMREAEGRLFDDRRRTEPADLPMRDGGRDAAPGVLLPTGT